MKIAIWGSLNHGNLGDDIMNIIIALHLKKNNCNPYLYRLNKKLASKYNLISVDSVDELIKDAVFTIIGGGSWLESRNLGTDFEKDFVEFIEYTNKYQVPFYFISIGGDTNNDFSLLSPERQLLLQNRFFKGGTVRLKSNLNIFKNINDNVKYFPDIVLLTRDYFNINISNKDNEIINIGISTYFKSFKHDVYTYLFEFYTRVFNKNINIYYLNTHHSDYGYSYEYRPPFNGSHIKVYKYTDLEDFIQFTNGLSLMASHKLHPGVLALSCDVPFIWIKGNDKVRAFLQEMRLSNYEMHIGLILKNILFGKIKQICNYYDFTTVTNAKKQAMGHLLFIDDLVKQYSNK